MESGKEEDFKIDLMSENKRLNRDRIITEQSSPRRTRKPMPFDIYDAYFPSSSESLSFSAEGLVVDSSKDIRKRDMNTKSMRLKRVLYRIIFIISWFIAFLGFKLRFKQEEDDFKEGLEGNLANKVVYSVNESKKIVF